MKQTRNKIDRLVGQPKSGAPLFFWNVVTNEMTQHIDGVNCE